MSTLTRSIEVDAPAVYANKEWTEFMFRQLIGHYQANLADIAEPVEGDEREAEAGTVKIAVIDDHRTRITVELEYTPVSWADADAEEERVIARMDRDLREFKLFLEARCREEECNE